MSIIQAINRISRLAAVAVALVAFGPAAHSQQPSAAAMATAKELITETGAAAVFNPLIAGVVEQAKLLYLQQNPALAKDLNEIAEKIRTDLAPRFAELTDEMAKLYATQFHRPGAQGDPGVLSVSGRQEAACQAADRGRRQHEIRAGPGRTSYPTK